ncbi:hypothetical protein ACFPIK_06150 [Algoriphagus aquatilis]|uniref:Uncharacterized protein n=1 Tax=Algoriphagus aquatilis TaxID=490186 RepID=A0ABW0BUS7_9BACT
MFSIDPVTAILSFVLFCAFSVPFIYHIQKNKAKEKLLLQKIKAEGQSQGVQATELETWRNQYAIGLDPSKKVLLYTFLGELEISCSIHLSDVKKVSISRKTREAGNEEAKRTLIDKVGLEFTHASAKKNTYFEFYDSELFSDLAGETLLAEKWAELIQKHL